MGRYQTLCPCFSSQVGTRAHEAMHPVTSAALWLLLQPLPSLVPAPWLAQEDDPPSGSAWRYHHIVPPASRAMRTPPPMEPIQLKPDHPEPIWPPVPAAQEAEPVRGLSSRYHSRAPEGRTA